MGSPVEERAARRAELESRLRRHRRNRSIGLSLGWCLAIVGAIFFFVAPGVLDGGGIFIAILLFVGGCAAFIYAILENNKYVQVKLEMPL